MLDRSRAEGCLAAWALSVALAAAGACRATPPAAAPADAATPPPASQAERAPAGRVVDLLGGSVQVEVPPQAEVSPAPHSVMSGPAPAQEQTRVVLEPGGDHAKFILVAQEGFVLGTGDAEADAKVYLGSDAEHLEIRPAMFEGPYDTALVARGPDMPGHDGPQYVLGAVFERDDRSLFEIYFLILPEMLDELAEYRQRALKILESAAPGPTPQPVAREHTFDNGVGETLTVTLPHPAALTQMVGPDFVVFRAREIRGLDDEAGVFGVYFGGHPSFQYNQQDESQTTQKRSGALLGRPTDWYVWTMPSGRQMAEAIVERGEHDFVHVFVHGAPEALDGLLEAAAAMTSTK